MYERVGVRPGDRHDVGERRDAGAADHEEHLVTHAAASVRMTFDDGRLLLARLLSSAALLLLEGRADALFVGPVEPLPIAVPMKWPAVSSTRFAICWEGSCWAGFWRSSVSRWGGGEGRGACRSCSACSVASSCTLCRRSNSC